MTPFSDARETRSLFDSYEGYIEQVRQVLRANHVPFGTPFDFLILAQTLENNSQLRNDLAVLLQSFMEGEKKITHPTALGIIAVASGGPDFTTSSSGMSPQASGVKPAGSAIQPVNVLVDLLMSVGGRTQTSAQNLGGHFDNHRPELIGGQTHPDVLPPPSSSGHETDFEQFAGAHSDDRSALEAVPAPSNQASNQAPNQTSNQDSLPEDPWPSSGLEDPLVESLTRLELNALEVMHYLDSIDQRISRIEPRLDNLPAYVPFPAAPHPESEYGHLPDGRYSAMLVATETLPHRPQESQDQPSPLDPSPTLTTIPPQMPSLLESSSRQKHYRKKFEVPIITAAALVLLLVLYWGFKQNTQLPAISPANPSLAQDTEIPSSNLSSANHANAVTRPSPSHGAVAADTIPRLHHRPLRNSTPADPEASFPASATATPATSAGAHESNDSPSLSTQPVNVSSGVMAANILSAPQPSYPKLASLTHMRGQVVIQAIISKEGTIENLHVIKGHHLLRGAATNAVRTWRYRPYLVNGRPVEVATTVSVDFNQVQ